MQVYIVSLLEESNRDSIIQVYDDQAEAVKHRNAIRKSRHFRSDHDRCKVETYTVQSKYVS